MSWFTDLGSTYHQIYFLTAFMVGLFCFYMMILVFQRYIQRKTIITMKLGFDLLFLGIALFLDPVFLFMRAAWDIDYVGLQGVLSFGFTGYANIFLILFLVEVFYKNQTTLFAKILILFEALVLPIGVYFYYTNQDTLPLLLIHLLASFIIYLTQFHQGIRLRRKLNTETPQDKVSINGFTFIGVAGLLQFLTFVSFIMQELSMFLGDLYIQWGLMQEGASIFIPIGFFLAGVAAFVLYLGFIMPDWIKRRWQVK